MTRVEITNDIAKALNVTQSKVDNYLITVLDCNASQCVSTFNGIWMAKLNDAMSRVVNINLFIEECIVNNCCVSLYLFFREAKFT